MTTELKAYTVNEEQRTYTIIDPSKMDSNAYSYINFLKNEGYTYKPKEEATVKKTRKKSTTPPWNEGLTFEFIKKEIDKESYKEVRQALEKEKSIGVLSSKNLMTYQSLYVKLNKLGYSKKELEENGVKFATDFIEAYKIRKAKNKK